MIGIDDATLMGGPPVMVAGTLDALKQERGILVDVRDMDDALRLARGLPGEGPRALRLGDRIDVNDHESIVVGTFQRSREFFWDAVIFTTYSRALAWAPPERRSLSYVMAKVEPDQDPLAVAARIERVTGLRALTPPDFERVSRDFILDRTGILANFGITIALGFVIGVLVAGQLLYNFVLDNSRAFASMKAMGATGGMLVRMVVVQVAFAAVTGFGLGVGAAALSGRALASSDLAFHMAWQVPVLGGLAIFLCCLLAALLSIARVLALEPAAVFKG
jgi:putative ABC transport system permease protein